MKTLFSGALALLFLLPLTAKAEKELQSDITEVSVERIEEGELEKLGPVKSDPTLGQILEQIDLLIAFGEKIYKLIERGRPVVNTQYASINVVPQNQEGVYFLPRELHSWSAPKFSKWKVAFKNRGGKEVIKFVYNLNFSYGGQLNGKGRYLSAVQIVPETISVGWGYKFESVYKLVNIVNHGTEEEAIAGATLELSYKIKTIAKEYRENLTFHVQGDGVVQELR